jgi:hypothetical protein
MLEAAVAEEEQEVAGVVEEEAEELVAVEGLEVAQER